MTPIYLDTCATTPLDERIKKKMEPFYSMSFGNPASSLHPLGWQAQSAVTHARAQVATLLNCDPSEITFTAGATESNNWALKGLVDHLIENDPSVKPHVLTSNVEHASVIEPLRSLERKNKIRLTLVPVNSLGHVTLESLQKHLQPDTKILSLIWCQNEIGTIQNMQAIADWAHSHGLFMHTDATQMVGKYPVDLSKTPISLLSFSGHKIYGPKGVGALFIRKKNPKVILEPLLHGGGQELAGRSGTLNVPGIVGLGEACTLALQDQEQDRARAQKWDLQLRDSLLKAFPQIQINGDIKQKSDYILSLTFKGLMASDLLPLTHGLCYSSGSACSTGPTKASTTLQALGHAANSISTTVRLSHGRGTTQTDIQQAVDVISKALKSLNFN